MTDARRRRIRIDAILAEELRRPGSDDRFGVNIVAYPDRAVRDAIARACEDLRAIEPDQYFYPPSDLHLTVFEVISGASRGDAKRCREGVERALPNELPSIRCAEPFFHCDENAAILAFRRADGLSFLRETLSAAFARHGVDVRPRRGDPSAHVTFLRYLSDLKTDLAALSARLGAVPIDLTLSWSPAEFWVTCGATWYGRRSCVRRSGPHRAACGGGSPPRDGQDLGEEGKRGPWTSKRAT